MPFPVFCRGYSRYFPELLVKMAQVVKTAAETNIRNAQLEYDARLMNQAIIAGTVPHHMLQQLLVASDVYTDPQALILSPGNVIRISKELVKGGSYDANARNGALTALDIIEEALASGSMTLPEMETSWLPLLCDELSDIPDHESEFVEMMLPLLDKSKFILAEYGL